MNADAKVSRFIPRLLGYEKAKQGHGGYVPGGFHITIVWERVPGDRLGPRIKIPDSPFWKLKRSLRDEIRTQLKDTFLYTVYGRLRKERLSPQAGERARKEK
ncbi:uncharacterized protein N7483_000291 [Penicillium malachiteum]|uniref:uncharacterized protein n=1 Tax=Penicillium malachiteum TaxID=1324776 RepID=UPI002549B8E6|nr:uncharacterized protein N7483_000291 [Penicillium malachiteum]KAJ5735166.1 hypothetical protein N7483_000291 [Penicillium malachiteum]